MSDRTITMIGQLQIVGAQFDRKLRVTGNPRVFSESQLESMLGDLYEVLRKHKWEGHIAVRYQKEIGTKVGT
jgi:hypothetical protein